MIIGICIVLPLVCTVFIVTPSSIFKVTAAWLQSVSCKQFTIPVNVAFNCKKLMSVIGWEVTSIVCCSGKNLKIIKFHKLKNVINTLLSV